MRYFLFTYSYVSSSLELRIGSITIIANTFPSRKEIEKLVYTPDSRGNIVVTGWNEFYSETDFNNFTGIKND